MKRERVVFFGVPLDPWTMNETVGEIDRRVQRGQFTQHVVVNTAKLVYMQQDPELLESVASCDIINVDGMGVVWGGRSMGLPIPERVAGIDLFYRLLDLAERRGYRVFFLGARPEVVERAVSKIQSGYPRLNIAGWHHGYFWDKEDDLVAKVKGSAAELLFVAVTSPMKEKFIARRGQELGVKFVMGVGGTFDVVAGLVKRAPLWMQNAGLEWFFRVLQEPRRMWKRYAVTNSKYAWMLLREKARLIFHA
jgi:N-acetylglucosaminyldiphosphoundecaprenol N-acetyl-beta-D-mannosaminyltransferase